MQNIFSELSNALRIQTFFLFLWVLEENEIGSLISGQKSTYKFALFGIQNIFGLDRGALRIFHGRIELKMRNFTSHKFSNSIIEYQWNFINMEIFYCFLSIGHHYSKIYWLPLYYILSRSIIKCFSPMNAISHFSLNDNFSLLFGEIGQWTHP